MNRLWCVLVLIFGIYGSLSAIDNCVLCDHQVLAEAAVYENELYYILVDRFPRTRGHLLVVPKRHVPKADSLSREEWAGLADIIPLIVKVFNALLETDQYAILEKNGAKIQEIPHVHFHLFPIKDYTVKQILNAGPQNISDAEFYSEIELFRQCFRDGVIFMP